MSPYHSGQSSEFPARYEELWKTLHNRRLMNIFISASPWMLPPFGTAWRISLRPTREGKGERSGEGSLKDFQKKFGLEKEFCNFADPTTHGTRSSVG